MARSCSRRTGAARAARLGAALALALATGCGGEPTATRPRVVERPPPVELDGAGAAPGPAAPTADRPDRAQLTPIVDDRLSWTFADYPRDLPAGVTVIAPARLGELRFFPRPPAIADAYWVFGPGPEPCKATRGPIEVDIDPVPLACSAVDCDLEVARVALVGCPGGALAVPAQPDAAPPSWRFLPIEVSQGGDVTALDPSTPAYAKKLERYLAAGGDYADPQFFAKAKAPTEIPARYQGDVPRGACGRRCRVEWWIGRIAVTPAIELVWIRSYGPRGEARCEVGSEELWQAFVVDGGGGGSGEAGSAVAIADGAQPVLEGIYHQPYVAAIVDGERVVELVPGEDRVCEGLGR
jgi:hypothetical protein